LVKRKIIEIDRGSCTGCGDCIPACPEGALQVVDGKAVLISDLFCDGLGACVGECPIGAMKVVEREAEPYDERRVMENIVTYGDNTIKAHLVHLRDHSETGYLKEALLVLKEKGLANPLENRIAPNHPHQGGCPGSRMMDMRKKESSGEAHHGRLESELQQWPVQLHLVPPSAPYFKGADLLISADCVPFTYAGFHQDLLKGKALAIACPKLDDIESYSEKLQEIMRINNPKSVTVAIMQVPCCGGLYQMVKGAAATVGYKGLVKGIVIGINGEILKEI